MSLGWAFELYDQMSGPAAKINRTLSALEGQMRSNERALRDLNRGQLSSQLLSAQGFRYDRIKLQLQRDQIRTARDLAREQRAGLGFFTNLGSALSPLQAARSGIHELNRSLRESAQNGGLFRSMMSGLGGVLGTVATTTAAVGAGVVALGASFAISTARAVDFGEAQRRMLMGRLGAVEGARQYEILIEYSNRYGQSLQETFSQFSTLSRAGFNQNNALSMMQQIGDVQAAMGGQAGQGITTAIRQIMDKPKMSMEELNQQLAEHGVNVGAVFSEMAHARRVSVQRVQQMFSGQQITKMEEISAIMRVLNRDFSQGGLAGTAMANRLRTMGGSIDLISTRWELFKTRVGETAAFEPVNRFLGRIAELMDQNTASGRHFQETLNSLFRDTFGSLDKTDPAALFDRFDKAVRQAVPAIRDAGTALMAIVEGFRTAATWADRLYTIWGYTPIGFAQRKLGEAMVSSTPPGVQRESHRSVDQAIQSQQAAQRRQGLWSSITGFFDRGDSVRPTAAMAQAAGIAPTVTAREIASQRNVNFHGGINVQVDGSNLQSGGATPAEVGQQIASSINEHLSAHLTSAAMSQGNPT